MWAVQTAPAFCLKSRYCFSFLADWSQGNASWGHRCGLREKWQCSRSGRRKSEAPAHATYLRISRAWHLLFSFNDRQLWARSTLPPSSQCHWGTGELVAGSSEQSGAVLKKKGDFCRRVGLCSKTLAREVCFSNERIIILFLPKYIEKSNYKN